MCPETFHVLKIKSRVRWKAWVTRRFLQNLADENFNMKMEKKKPNKHYYEFESI